MKIIPLFSFLLILSLLACGKDNNVVSDKNSHIQFKCLEGEIKVLDDIGIWMLGADWMSKEQYIKALYNLSGSIEFAEESYEEISKYFYTSCHSK